MSDEVMGGVPDFKDVKYIRPDLDKFTELVRGVRLRLMTAKTVEAADEAFMISIHPTSSTAMR